MYISNQTLYFGFEKINTRLPSSPSERVLAQLFPNKLLDNVLVTKSGDCWGRAESMNYQVELIQYSPLTRHTIASYVLKGFFWDKQPMLEGSSGDIWMAGYGGNLARINPVSRKISIFNFNDPAEPLAERASSTALYEDKTVLSGSAPSRVLCAPFFLPMTMNHHKSLGSKTTPMTLIR